MNPEKEFIDIRHFLLKYLRMVLTKYKELYYFSLRFSKQFIYKFI